MDPLKRKDLKYEWYQMGLFWTAEGFNGAQLRVASSAFSLGLNPGLRLVACHFGNVIVLIPCADFWYMGSKLGASLPATVRASFDINRGREMGHDRSRYFLYYVLWYTNESGRTSSPCLYRRYVAILRSLESGCDPEVCRHHRTGYPLLLDFLAHIVAVLVSTDQHMVPCFRLKECLGASFTGQERSHAQ